MTVKKHNFSFWRMAGMGVVGVFFAAVMALVFGVVVMLLWNWLMPVIFNLPIISFWQAWGLVLLSHILFKSFNHPNHPHPPHHISDGCESGNWKDHFRSHMHRHWHEDETASSEEQTA